MQKPTRNAQAAVEVSKERTPLACRTCYLTLTHTVRPSVRLENDEYRVQPYPYEWSADGQTYWQCDVHPMSLGWWIDEVGNHSRRRLQAWPTEHCLCCRCHRFCCSIRHPDSLGDIAALLRDKRFGKISREGQSLL